ncbi:hypothetical protein WOLCODRAFT_91613 [Wolfiporia cocos MD-104 SS10]|uniref:Potassium transport protein n=1 Tax=Wolfiporia cocos (strain MD-104) TaxID=742152 RepID=A0A2H3JFT7_WOLCO|nr:hypothetical protein WOLCODRAFT_91613 [Wolfiporia cocos MD-104 SS10]
MIRRTDARPRLVNPSGWISEGRLNSQPPPNGSALQYHAFADIDDPDLNVYAGGPHSDHATGHEIAYESRSETESSSERDTQSTDQNDVRAEEADHSDDGHPFPRSTSIAVAAANKTGMPRTQTVEFAPVPKTLRQARSAERDYAYPLDGVLQSRTFTRNRTYSQTQERSKHSSDRNLSPGSMRRPTMSWPHSMDSQLSAHATHALHSGFGGFPMPHELLSSLIRRFFPNLQRKLTRTVTIPRTRTIASQHGSVGGDARSVPYISFEAVVGRNSEFKSLTHEQLEELGGVEYRALGALLWIVGGYHIGLQLLAFVIIAPYMSMSRWKEDFVLPQLHRDVSPVWFCAFQVVSAYTNTGTSLEDQSMVPFQRAYPLIFVMVFLILAGNTAFTLHFLLDHPRRCFIYLFPSHQTWFLLTVLFALNATDWFFFLVLDLGNPAVTSIPVGVRVAIGVLQAVAVRAAGFGTVTLAALAPAVKTLYVVMMYVSVCDVRSTNVYEEKSLGIFEDDESVDDEFGSSLLEGSRVTVWSRYLAMHMRKQLSFDMWWLATALVLVCIIERDNLENEANAAWFNIFRTLFELVSAYGTVGLSLGVPDANFSFSGALRPLSKLIVCAVMLRGRHRGLPVAIDRAVMLPFEFRKPQEDTAAGTFDTEFGNKTISNGDAISEKLGPEQRPRSLSAPRSIVRNSADLSGLNQRLQTSRIQDEEASPL